MTSTPAGWFPDPGGQHEQRYWDGTHWTEHVFSHGTQGREPLTRSKSSQATAESMVRKGQEPQPPETPQQFNQSTGQQPVTDSSDVPLDGPRYNETLVGRGATEAELSPLPTAEGEPVKITAFNSKRLARELQQTNTSLRLELTRARRLLSDLGALEAAERQRRIAELARAESDLAERMATRQGDLAELDRALIVNRDRLALEAVGLFDFEHPAEASASLATDLEGLRSEIRQINKIGTAITATANFTFNNSMAKGRTFVNQMSRIMLRAYNAEAENAVKTVKAGNLSSAQKRLSTAREQIAKQGTMIDLAVTEHYHRLRLRELELAARHLQAIAAERELERERRAELREQKVLEAEIKREKERLEKERAHYLNSIQRLTDAGDHEGAAALQADLDRVDDEIAKADYRAANIRAGYVYVISNLGAFGEGVVKIGMTRRLEPKDRIRELGDASVPFTFDVHALFFSDDAVSIEAMLHREFAKVRLNKVNPRKEFFRAEPQAVLDALKKHNVAVLEFTTHAAAEDYRMSWPAATADLAPAKTAGAISS